MKASYSNTIVAALVGLVALAIIAFYVLPEGPAATVFSGLVVMIALQLLAVRQQEANGHRINRAEDAAVVAATSVQELSGQVAHNTGQLSALPQRVEVVNAPSDPVPVTPTDE